MAKTSGGVRNLTTNGVRSVSTRSSERTFSNDAREYFDGIATNYGRSIDYSGYSTQRLEQLVRKGRDYNPSDRAQAIANYEKYAKSVTGGNFRSIEHASLEGARSELIRVANRAAIHNNLNAIKAEIRRRKGR